MIICITLAVFVLLENPPVHLIIALLRLVKFMVHIFTLCILFVTRTFGFARRYQQHIVLACTPNTSANWFALTRFAPRIRAPRKFIFAIIRAWEKISMFFTRETVACLRRTIARLIPPHTVTLHSYTESFTLVLCSYLFQPKLAATLCSPIYFVIYWRLVSIQRK